MSDVADVDALHTAAKAGQPSQCISLIEKGIPVDTVNLVSARQNLLSVFLLDGND